MFEFNEEPVTSPPHLILSKHAAPRVADMHAGDCGGGGGQRIIHGPLLHVNLKTCQISNWSNSKVVKFANLTTRQTLKSDADIELIKSIFKSFFQS